MAATTSISMTAKDHYQEIVVTLQQFELNESVQTYFHSVFLSHCPFDPAHIKDAADAVLEYSISVDWNLLFSIQNVFYNTLNISCNLIPSSPKIPYFISVIALLRHLSCFPFFLLYLFFASFFLEITISKAVLSVLHLF